MYNFVDDKDNYKLISNKDGKIKSIIFKDKYTHIDKVLTLQPLDKNLVDGHTTKKILVTLILTIFIFKY